MVELHIGPVDTDSARSWVGSARRVLAWLRADDDRAREFPADVGAEFDSLIDQLDAATGTDPFEFRTQLDPAQLRRLVSYWFRTAAVVIAHAEEPNTPLPPPESEPFRLAITDAAAAAIDELEESEDFGATFKDAWNVPQARESVDAAPPAGLARVVVVDDSADMRLLLRTALELDPRFEFAGEAVDGSDAIGLCGRAHPDVVVLDLRMPGMDGFQALPLLRDGCPKAKIVVFSAEAGVDVEQRVKQLGASRLITKGVPLAELLHQLAAAAAS